MRIGLVTNLYPPVQTGTAHWTQELAHHLTVAGHQVTVIAATPEGAEAPREELDRGASVHRLPARQLRTSRLLLGFDEFFLANTTANRRRICEILAADRVEVVHQCGHLLDLTYATPVVARRLGIPAVCSIHTIIHSPASRVLDLMMKTVDRTLVRRYGPLRYDALIALDAEVRRYIAATYRHPQVRTVLVPIDDDVLDSPMAAPDGAGPFRILSVGHVTAMRSRVDLIAAVERLHRRGANVELLVVGKVCDPQSEIIVNRRGLADVVRFTGELPRAQVFELARTCHMEAHWISVPGLGTATLEAMALGLPVMAWAFAGLYDDVPLRDDESLLMIEPGNVDQIADRIQQLIDDSDRRTSIGAAGRTLVREHLSWRTALSRMEAVYAEALGRDERAPAFAGSLS